MSRLEAQAIMNYYPCPPAVVQMAASWLVTEPGKRINIIDPCMGEGRALWLMQIALAKQSAKVFSYGIELDSERFKAASELLADDDDGSRRYLEGATEFASVAYNSFSLMWLNPPFDNSGQEELAWLKRTTHWLADDGVLIFLTTRRNLEMNWPLGEYLAHYYDIQQIARFPEADNHFGEVIVIARKMSQTEVVASADRRTNTFRQYFYDAVRRIEPLRLRGSGEAALVVPHVTAPKRFEMKIPGLGEAVRNAAVAGISSSDVWRELVTPETLAANWRPMMDIREGHVPNLLAAGVMEAMPLVDPELGRIIVKGYGVKVRGEPEVESDDGAGNRTLIEREQAVVTLSAFNVDTGKVTTYSTENPAEFEQFLMRHIETFRAAILNLFAPEFDAPATLSKYLAAQARFASPGVMPRVTRVRLADGSRGRILAINGDSYRIQTDDGDEQSIAADDVAHTYRLMMPPQFIRAAAMAEHLRRNQSVGELGEMGTGKTLTSVLALYMLAERKFDRALAGDGQAKIVILSPGTMLEKWAREIRAGFSKFDSRYFHVYIPRLDWQRRTHYHVVGSDVLCNHCGKKVKASLERLAQANTVLCSNKTCRKPLVEAWQNEIAIIDQAFTEPGVSVIILSYEDAKLDAPWVNTAVPRVHHCAPLSNGRTTRLSEGPLERAHCPTCGGLIADPQLADEETAAEDNSPLVELGNAQNYQAFAAARRKQYCQCPVERPVRDEDTGEIVYQTEKVTVPRGAVTLVQDIEYFINEHGQKDQRPKFDANGQPVMVEYRPGSSYLSTSTTLSEQVEVEVSIPKTAPAPCGTPLFQFVRFNDREARYALLPRGVYHRRVPGVDYEFPRGSARTALGRYIARHYARRYYLIADELHRYKAATSTIGLCYQWMRCRAIKAIGLTGTVYGGKASTIFDLFHRTFKRFRDTYAHNDSSRFVDEYGIREFITSIHADKGRAAAKYYGAVTSRMERREQEGNGANPSIVRWILPEFAQIATEDLEIDLPERTEIFHALGDPGAESALLALGVDGIQAQYEKARAEAYNGDMSRLSAWIQASLGWVLSPDQDERWMHPKYRERYEYLLKTNQLEQAEAWRQEHEELWASAIPCDKNYESRLHASVADQCLTDWKEHGDRSIVFVSGVKRPAHKHFYRAMKRRGLTVCVLTTSSDTAAAQWCDKEDLVRCDPADREAEIERQVVERGIQVLICNPKLVEVGLDLVAFNRGHVAGMPSPSLYTMVQAFARIHRPGQQKPVVWNYWFYGSDPRIDRTRENHIQALWMFMLSEKIAAAGIVTGDVGASLAAISQQASGRSLIKDLQKVLLGDDMPQVKGNAVSFKRRIVHNPHLVALGALMEDADDARVSGQKFAAPAVIELGNYVQVKQERVVDVVAEPVVEEQPVPERTAVVSLCAGPEVDEDTLLDLEFVEPINVEWRVAFAVHEDRERVA
jgi:hypothetical protein